MASTSASGTGCAAPTAASAASRTRIALALALAIAGLSAAEAQAPAGGTLDIAFEGLRSSAGTLKICLTTHPNRFPDCQADPDARHATIAAASPTIRFSELPAGSYAIAVIHDENNNSRLDRRLGIPTEGVGFSRNPRLYFGPPAFKAAAFDLPGGERRETVRMKYFL